MILTIEPVLEVGIIAAPTMAVVSAAVYRYAYKRGMREGQAQEIDLAIKVKDETKAQIETAKQEFIETIQATLQAMKRKRSPKAQTQQPSEKELKQ